MMIISLFCYFRMITFYIDIYQVKKIEKKRFFIILKNLLLYFIHLSLTMNKLISFFKEKLISQKNKYSIHFSRKINFYRILIVYPSYFSFLDQNTHHKSNIIFYITYSTTNILINSILIKIILSI
jgi:hypothetical protein